jgi:DNA (cytosine-5)-methyltransferase 1
MTAYYNEIDPYCAQWLRNLISRGLIAPGDVDERDIRDVRPDDLRGYTQCHWFAGVAGWSAALRGAGWPDDRPVWTGSCPCQPFSAAGQGGGFADERHLWPAFFHLIDECRPSVVLGEQVASKDGLAWLDLVQADLEGADYAVGAVDLCAAGVGAPHIRQRLWWVADAAHRNGRGRECREKEGARAHGERRWGLTSSSAARELADGSDVGRRKSGANTRGVSPRDRAQGRAAGLVPSSATGGVGYAERLGAGRDAGASPEAQGRAVLRPERHDARSPGPTGALADDDETGRSELRRPQLLDGEWPALGYDIDRRGPVGGFWSDADWIYCRDGKWRPVEPGTFPLAHGAPARVGRLRAYGNAINKEAAEAFIGAYLTIEHDEHLRLSGGIFA